VEKHHCLVAVVEVMGMNIDTGGVDSFVELADWSRDENQEGVSFL
jgi:hypothetical protein